MIRYFLILMAVAMFAGCGNYNGVVTMDQIQERQPHYQDMLNNNFELSNDAKDYVDSLKDCIVDDVIELDEISIKIVLDRECVKNLNLEGGTEQEESIIVSKDEL